MDIIEESKVFMFQVAIDVCSCSKTQTTFTGYLKDNMENLQKRANNLQMNWLAILEILEFFSCKQLSQVLVPILILFIVCPHYREKAQLPEGSV